MNKVGKQVLGSVTRISIMDYYISEVGRGKSFFDVNFGVNMKHVLKVVETEYWIQTLQVNFVMHLEMIVV